jgi:hypothetical protein
VQFNCTWQATCQNACHLLKPCRLTQEEAHHCMSASQLSKESPP